MTPRRPACHGLQCQKVIMLNPLHAKPWAGLWMVGILRRPGQFDPIWLTMTRKHIGGLISWTLPTLQGSRSLVSWKYVARYGPPQLDLIWIVELLFLGHNSMNFQSRHKAEASYPCRTTWKTGRLWGSFWTKMRILQQDEHWNICTFSIHCHRGGRVPVSKYWQHADGEDWFIIYIDSVSLFSRS